MARKKAAPPDTREAAEAKGDPAKFWHEELRAAEKREQNWYKRADRVVARYRDEREREENGERRTNILWSNTETLKSALFQRIGNPDVRKRFPKKGKDEKAARTAALVLERSLACCIDDTDAHDQIEAAVEDHLLAGRGQVWIVYDAEVVEEESEDDAETTEAVDIASQSVRSEHVYWKDYRTSAGRKESDIWWKARRHQYTRDELTRYFPEHGEHVPLDAEVDGCPKQGKDSSESFKRANVWEIWDKTKKERVYVAEGYQFVLKKDDDPYRLKQFFPCPSALYGVKTTSTLVPIPEYTLYQDQCEELDAITTRLNRLIDALKRRGVYDASMEGPDNQLSQLAYAGDNEFLPYKGFAALMEKGGLAGVFQTEDLKPIIEVVQQLYQQRATLIQTIYEVTGISDVVRGATNPNETATAQRIKGQFASLRITSRQNRVDTFIRDIFRLKAEIMAEHFTRDKLSEMTGIDMPLQMEIDGAKQQLQMIEQQAQQAQQAQQQPQQPGQQPAPMLASPAPQPDPEMVQQLQATVKAVAWEDIAAILRSDERRGYKVEIESEDTAQVDEDAEKQRRIELLTTMQPVLQNALVMVQQEPAMLPLAKETLLFTIKGFKVGRSLEEAFEDAFDDLVNRPPSPPKPDPEMEKVEIEKQRAQADIQIKQQSAQADIEAKKIDHQLKQADLQLKSVELQGKQAEMAMRAQQMDMDFLSDQMSLQHQAESHEREAEAHAMSMEGARAAQDQKAEAASVALDGAKQSQQQKAAASSVKASGPSSNVISLPQAQAPQSQLQQVLIALAQGQAELVRSNEMLVRAVTAPRTTKLVRDQQGRSIGAVQTVMNFDDGQMAMAN
jgi:hypothetical protein